MAKQTIVEGQTATNRATGEKIVYRAGKWYPLGTGQAAAPPPKLSPQDLVALNETRNSANAMGEMAGQAQKFVELNRRAGTGPIMKIPGAKTLMNAFKPELAQMDALAARMAPAQRVPGSGTTSDKDLELFMAAIPSVERMGVANEAIASDMQTMAKSRMSRAAFFDRWAQERGTLLGAQEAWQATQGKTRPPPRPAGKSAGAGWKIVP